MKEDLANYIKQNKLFARQDKLLLAISAGADSVALSHLLKELGYNISLAHCNFGLRNEQSDADEFFVAELAKKWDVNCFTKSSKQSICQTKENLNSNGSKRIALQLV